MSTETITNGFAGNGAGSPAADGAATQQANVRQSFSDALETDLPPQQRREALASALRAPNVTAETRKNLAFEATKDLPTTEKTDVVTENIKSLPAEAQKAIIAGLSNPSDKVRDGLWLIVIWGFAIVMVGSFLTLAISVFTVSNDNTLPQVVLTVFTTVVGFLSGLFAPSPVTKT